MIKIKTIIVSGNLDVLKNTCFLMEDLSNIDKEYLMTFSAREIKMMRVSFSINHGHIDNILSCAIDVLRFISNDNSERILLCIGSDLDNLGNICI